MKLDELCDEPNLLDLLESLNYQPDVNWDGDVGHFYIKNQHFSATIRPANPIENKTFLPFFPEKSPKVGNVDFSMITSGDKTTQDTTGMMGSSAFKVFSGVAYIVSELSKKYNYDILLCVAKQKASPTNFQNRVDAYDIITDRAARKAGMMHSKMWTSPGETVFALYKPSFQSGIVRVKTYMDSL
ncbi:hypothetical protein M0R04_07270 [Candidatus Dojkabacteria bacterium]|jgi:hypothetical protein|nr:hypothetical protein [Candidatus Dojkabacteria bacterium]